MTLIILKDIKKNHEHLWESIKIDRDSFLTRKSDRASIGLPGNSNSFLAPPASFQCMNLLVGGARFNFATISVVSDIWDSISLIDKFFTSSTISFCFGRFRLLRVHAKNE